MPSRFIHFPICTMKTRRAIRDSGWTDGAAWALLIIYVVAFSWMAIRQHDGFHTNALDLAKFDQAIWNTSRGRPFHTTLIQDSIIQSHFSPIFALYAPLYWLWPNIRLLFIIQAICLGGAGALIYCFFREKAPYLGLSILMAYLMHPALHQINLVEFRRITPAALTTSFVLFQMLKRRYGWMMLGLGIGLLCKEDMAFLVIGVALYLMIAHRAWRVGVPIFVLGLAWLILVPFLLLPALDTPQFVSSNEGYSLAGKYFSYLGSSPAEMMRTLWRDPGRPLDFILRTQRLRAIWRLSWPMAFLFLLAPEITIFTLPFLGYLLASKSDTMGRLEAWYPTVILVLLYWAVAVGLSRLRGRWRSWGMTALLIASVGGWFTLSEVQPARWFRPGRFEVTAHHRQVEAALRQIPTDAVVAAQDPLVPHLSHREQIYLFPWVPDGVQPDYVALDQEMGTYPLERPAYRTQFYNLLAGTEYEITQQIDSFYVFHYVAAVAPDVKQADRWGDSLTLIGYSLAAAEPGEPFAPLSAPLSAGSTVRIALFWRVEQPIPQNYTVFVHLLDGSDRLLAQHDSWPAEAHRPTSILPAGAIVRDVHNLRSSEMIPLESTLRVGLYEDITGTSWLTEDGQEFVILPLCEISDGE